MSEQTRSVKVADGTGQMTSLGKLERSGAVVLLVMVALFVLTQLYLAIPLFKYVEQNFSTTAETVRFVLVTCFSMAYAGGFLIWGPLSDQFGRRSMMIVGLVTLSIATLACAFAPSLLWLAGLRTVQGLVASSFAPIALVWLAEMMPPNRRATAIGAMSTAFLVAGIFGQVSAAWIALHWDWNSVFLVTGTSLVVTIPMVAVMVKEPIRPTMSGHLGHRFIALGAVAMQPAILVLSLAHVMLLLPFVAMYTALGPHLDMLGLAPGKVILLRLFGLPGMFVALLVGPLAVRIGIPRVAETGYVFAAAGLALEAVFSHSLVGIAIGSLIFVTGVALAMPSMITQFGNLAAPNRAAGMALNGFVLFIGASIGPLIAAQVYSFFHLLAGLAVALVLAAVCVAGSTSLASPRKTPLA